MKKQYYVLALLAIIFFAACSKQNDIPAEASNLNTIQQNKMNSNTENPSSPYQLVSFTAQYGGTVKYGNCRVATVVFNWTATGETNITHYDLQTSDSNNSSSFNNLGSYPSSNNDQSISRSITSFVWGNGATVTKYYRLNIFYTNNTNSFGPVRSVTINTTKCISQF